MIVFHYLRQTLRFFLRLVLALFGLIGFGITGMTIIAFLDNGVVGVGRAVLALLVFVAYYTVGWKSVDIDLPDRMGQLTYATLTFLDVERHINIRPPNGEERSFDLVSAERAQDDLLVFWYRSADDDRPFVLLQDEDIVTFINIDEGCVWERARQPSEDRLKGQCDDDDRPIDPQWTYMGRIHNHEEGKTFVPERGWPPAQSDDADDPWIPSVPGCLDADGEASCP